MLPGRLSVWEKKFNKNVDFRLEVHDHILQSDIIY